VGDAAAALLCTHPFGEAHGRVGVGSSMVPAGGEEECGGGDDGGCQGGEVRRKRWARAMRAWEFVAEQSVVGGEGRTGILGVATTREPGSRPATIWSSGTLRNTRTDGK